jgi:hypothetical protein
MRYDYRCPKCGLVCEKQGSFRDVLSTIYGCSICHTTLVRSWTAPPAIRVQHDMLKEYTSKTGARVLNDNPTIQHEGMFNKEK